MANDNKWEGILSSLGSVLSTLGLMVGSWTVNETTLNSLGSGLGDTSADSQEDPELAAALSFGFGAGTSSYNPAPQVFITLADNKPTNQVEQKAKSVYDKYDHNHIKSKDEGTSMIITDSEAKELFDYIIENSRSREELISSLDAIESIIEELPQEEMQIADAKVKKLNHE